MDNFINGLGTTYTSKLETKDICAYDQNNIYDSSGNIITTQSLPFYYNNYKRLEIDKKPSLICDENSTKYTGLNVFLLTADEAYFAGTNGSSNDSVYLKDNTSTVWWTMTPSGMNTALDDTVYTFYKTGAIMGNTFWNEYQVRPVVSIKATETIEDGGDGTIGNPYVVS